MAEGSNDVACIKARYTELKRQPCWRCGKDLEVTLSICPHCHARAAIDGSVPGVNVAERTMITFKSPIVSLVAYYAVLLATSIVYGCMFNFGLVHNVRDQDAESATALLYLGTAECID